MEYSNAYSKTSGTLWQHYRDEPVLDKSCFPYTKNSNIIDFSTSSNNSTLLKFKKQKTGQTLSGGTKDIEIMVPLTYLSNFWRAPEMSLTNCEIKL